MTCEHSQQCQSHLQPYRGKRSLLERHAFRQAPSAVPFSAVKISLFLVLTTIIGTRNALANAKSVNRHLRNPLFLSHLRGGESSAVNISSGGAQPQLNDEELDDYIDFLLAYADDQATEADNPLFRDEAPLPEDIEEDTVMEDNFINTQGSSETNNAAVEPLVDDINDDTQIDTMVEALVASIDDEELENEKPLEGLDDGTNTIRISEAADALEIAEESLEEAIIVEKEIDENDLQEVQVEAVTAIDKDVEETALENRPAEEVEVESETFYLGSSAVENMPLPVNEGNSSVGPATDAMLAKGDLDGETAEITTESTKRVTLFTSFMKKIGLKKEDSEVVDAVIVDSNEPIEETTNTKEDIDLVKVTEVVLDSSGAAEEPAITVSGPEIQSPIIEALGESDVPEKKVEREISQGNDAEITDAIVVDEVVDQATKASIVSSVQQYYQGALGSIKDLWSKKRWYSHRGTKAIDEGPPERDYTKIYKKYFAANNQIPDVNEISTQEESNRLRSAFLKPWGTVTKYFKPKEFDDTEDSERSHIDDYSIGIKAFVTEDSNRATASQVEVDYDEPGETAVGIEHAETNIGSEIATTFVEGSGETTDSAEFTVAEENYREETHIERTPSATEDLNVEIDIGETTVEAEVEELSEDVLDESEIVTEVEVVGEEHLEDAEVVTEDIEVKDESEGGQDVKIVTESTEVEDLSEDVEQSVAVEFDSDSMEVIEEAVLTEVTEVEAGSTEVPEDSKVVTEFTEEEADTVTRVTEEVEERVQEDSEIITEVTEVEVDSVEVTENAEIVTESTEVEVDGEDAPEDVEIFTEFSKDVDSEKVPEDTEIATGVTEEGEDVQEGAEVVTEVIEERVDIDMDPEDSELVTEFIEGDADNKEDTEVEIDSVEVLEAATEDFEEIDIEEAPEVSIEVPHQDKIEEVPEDTETVTEVIKEERNDNEGPEGIEIVTEVTEEVNSEEVPDDAEVVIEVTEVEDDSLETLEDMEIVTERTEAEVDCSEIKTGETLQEFDESADSGDDIPAKVPRRSNVFTRLWGTRKVPNTFNKEKVDIEVTGMAAEETVVEPDKSLDDHKTTSENRPHHANVFIRLWGTVKQPKEIYSLGLQGVREVNDSEICEDNGEISDNDAVESLEDVDDTSMSDVEMNDSEIIGEIVTSGNASIEDKQSERNVLQLHNPEREEKEDRIGLLENASVEVPNILSSSEDSIESVEISTCHQLDEDISMTVSDGNDDVDESEIEVEYYPNDSEDAFLNEAVDNTISEDDEDSIDEADEEENASEFTVADADQYVFSDDEDSIEEIVEEDDAREFRVVEADQYIVAEEDEQFIENSDEEDVEGSIISDVDDFIEEVDEEDLEIEFVVDHVEDEYSIQQGDMEEGVEEDVSIKTFEQEELLDELESLQTEEEIEDYANEMDEEYSFISEGMGSAPYSLEVEIQNANFLTKFLLKKSMGQVIMIAIVITEWFRVYILAPFLESIEWIKEGKGQDILQTMINMRGGALASPLINMRGGALASLSESEDVDQANEEEKIEKGEEEEDKGASTEHQYADLNDTDKSDSDSSKDSHKGDAGQVDSTDSEKSTADTAPAEIPLPTSRELRPNFIFRRLLNHGFFGHIVIMEMILASEWLNLYVPQIRSMANFIAHDVLKYKKKHGRRPGEPDNFWDSGFVNIGDGSRLPQKSRKQRKKADLKAMDDLKSIGNASEAKYRFVSQRFMKRHGLGPYRVAVSEIELDLESPKEGLESNKYSKIEEDEAESDSGWILDALGVEEDKDNALSSAPFDTSVGVAINNGVPKVSVGLSLNLGKKKGKSSSSQKIRSAIVGNGINKISSKSKNSSKPRVSDSESGIMGRLRAQGANSLVGRNILGAYPGDLPPPDDAADPRGVIDMAQRYGYGDWSDEEDEVDEYAFGGEKNNNEDDSFADDYVFRPKKRSRRTRTKKRRSSSSRNQQTVGVGFDLNLGTSSQESVSLSNVSARRKSTVSTSRSSSSSGSTLSSGSRRRRKSRSSPHSPAMEELGESPRSRSASITKTSKTAKRTISSTDTKIKGILTDSAARKRKTRTLRPAMSIIDEKKANEDQ